MPTSFASAFSAQKYLQVYALLQKTFIAYHHSRKKEYFREE